jgi:hypothetical protein
MFDCLDLDPFDQVTQDRLAIRRAGDRPKGGNVSGQGRNSLSIRAGEFSWASRLGSRELFLQTSFGAQGLLPAALQFPRHQPILRLRRVVLAMRSLGW